MEQETRVQLAKIIADHTSMSSKDLRLMSTICLMAAEIAHARETGNAHPAPAPTDG